MIAYKDEETYGTAIVGTVSGTGISFGSSTTFNAANTYYNSIVFDSTNNKVVIAYMDAGNSNRGTAIVGTVSGTSISLDLKLYFDLSIDYISAAYDSSINKVIIAYRGSSYHGTAVAGTVSGTSISFGSEIKFKSSALTDYTSVTYDSTNQKVVIAYSDNGNSDYGTSTVFSPVTMSNNLTAENFIGISDGAYTNGQTATIQLTGAVDDAQSGLTPGQSYYVQNDGTLSETADNPSVFAGTSLSSTKLIVRG